MKIPFTIEWKKVTPALAAEWLTRNPQNRALRETTVDSFARDMLTNNWSPNHQGVAFAEGGDLIDGQHRLAAIVRSQKAQWLVIFTGVPVRFEGVETKVMDTVDRGNARSIADILRLEHGVTTDAPVIAAACLTIARLCVPVSTRAKRATIGQTVAIMGRYAAALKFAREHRSATTGLRSALVMGAVAFAHAVAPTAAAEFYRGFASGSGIVDGSPILTLRNHVMSSLSFGSGCAHERRQDADLVLHAIGCHRAGVAMPRIPRPNERARAQWFRDHQAEDVAAIAALFPAFAGEKAEKIEKATKEKPERSAALTPAAEGVVDAKTVKLTPLAESLIRGKEMSEKLNRKLMKTP